LNWITIEEIAGSVGTQNREVAIVPEGPQEVLNDREAQEGLHKLWADLFFMTNWLTFNPSAQREVLSAGTASCDVQHGCSMASACSPSLSLLPPTI